MKTGITLRGIEIEGIKLGEVKIEQEYSLTEAIGTAKFVKEFIVELIEEMPSIINKVENAFNGVEEVQERNRINLDKKQTTKRNERARAMYEAKLKFEEAIKNISTL